MKENNYDYAKDLLAADELKRANHNTYITRMDDGSVKVTDGFTARYYPNGLVTVYPNSGQPSWLTQANSWPEGVGRAAFTTPWKEYVTITGNDKVVRNYVLPKGDWSGYGGDAAGLILQPHPDLLYVPVEIIPDYHISVSRKQKNDAIKKWQPFLDYCETMRPLLPPWPQLDAEARSSIITLAGTPLRRDDKQNWYAKCAFSFRSPYNSGPIHLVSHEVMEQDLPYNIELVPVTLTSHSKHWNWNLIDQLSKAGRLKDLPEYKAK